MITKEGKKEEYVLRIVKKNGIKPLTDSQGLGKGRGAILSRKKKGKKRGTKLFMRSQKHSLSFQERKRKERSNHYLHRQGGGGKERRGGGGALSSSLAN